MNEFATQEWEVKKLQAEVEKLKQETSVIQENKLKSWITLISIVSGIIVSAFGLYNATHEIAIKNKQLAMESKIRSHQIFLNDVLDRMSGMKTNYQERNSDGKFISIKREIFGGTTQVGAYGAAIALACEFENLRLPAKKALEWQIKITPRDEAAPIALEQLMNKCR